ncbi:hypothetical protein HaLaN_11964 [Haematococcus lacustris]|uniref:Uncharacterized protein n=1 Tax=Haematococcus lacustris TaxID=44745 RepID=A0A699Z239_HAELA|nr:hypothetical protein HaLaN_11964 [Haematococcus lacustris]
MIPRMRERLPSASKVYAVLFMLLAAHGHQVSAQIAQAGPVLPGASSTAVASGTPPSSSPATEKAVATMLVAALNTAGGMNSSQIMLVGQPADSTPSGSMAPMPAVDAAKYPALTTLLNNNANTSDPLGLRDAVTTALSQQQGAGDVYAAQLEQAAGVINGFTTPLQFGTLGTVRNYITRVIQVNTLLGSIQRYLTPTSQLAAQRLLFDGIRLSINFVTTFPVAYLVYISRVFIAARDYVRVARDSVNVATAIINLVVLVSTNPVNFQAINNGTGPGGLFANFPTNGSRGCYTGPGSRPACVPPPPPPAAQGKRLLEAGSEALEPLTQSSNPLEELAAQLAASGMTSRDLLAVGPLGGNLAGIAEEVRSSLFTTVGSVEDVVQALLARVTPLIDSDSFDFRQALTPSGDFLTNAASVVRNATSQLEATVQRLGGAVFNTLFQPPITNVSRVNIGNCTNGLPAGVIGLPAVPQLGLPAIPFPAGFPAPPPALNANVLNLLRTAAGITALTVTILNLIQSILQAIGDNIAVIPAAIALITGPILFELASVDYYNLLVAAFPGVPNGYLIDLNTALGGIGARLTNPNNVFLGGTGVPQPAPAASAASSAVSTPSPSPATQQAIAAMLAAAFDNAATASGGSKTLESQGQSAGQAAAAPMPAIDAAKYPELATLMASKSNGEDPLGLRTAVATALSQQQGAGDVYAAQLEQAAGVINSFATPIQFGTLGSVRNYITRVIQINTLLGSIQRYLQPTSQLAVQRLVSDGIRLAVNFVTATQVINLVVLVSTNPVNFSAINAGVGPGGLFASFPGATTAFGFGKRLLEADDESVGMAATRHMLESDPNFQQLVSHLAAAGMTTRDLLGVSTDSSAGAVKEASRALLAAEPTAASNETMVAQVYELSDQVNKMLENVQDMVATLVPRLSAMTDESAAANYDYRKPVTADAVFRAGKALMRSAEAVNSVSGRMRQTIFGLPPVTVVPPQNIGTGANGLPAGVIGLPAVPALGLPGIPFPGGFPPVPPPFNAAVLNLLRTIAVSLTVANNVLNVVATILEAIADNLAVPPAAIALVTGPILFSRAALDYYNNLVASFPAVPNGYLSDLNIALGGFGAALSSPANVFLGSAGASNLAGAGAALTGASASLGTVRGALAQVVG